MGVSIPLGGTGGGPVTIPIGIGGAVANTNSRDQEMLRAVAAAATLGELAEVSHTIKVAKDPGQDLDNFDPKDLKEVLTAVDSARSNRPGAAPPEREHTLVAQAVRADPVLVRAAFAVTNADKAKRTAALLWIAHTDVRLLEQAASAASAQGGLGLVAGPPTQLGQLEMKVTDAKKQLDALTRQLEDLVKAGGVKGDKGDKGDQGDKGDRGDKGEKGDPGAAVDPVLLAQAFADAYRPLYDQIDRLRAHCGI
jgi:hypothetical protein